MGIISSEITIADFKQTPWHKALEEAEHRDCLYYVSSFNTYYKRARTDRSKNVYMLLSAICSMMLQPDKPDQPLGPSRVMAGSSTPIPDNLGKEELDVLSQLVSIIKDPELLARVSDILWITRSDHKMARIAVDAYLESAKQLEDSDSPMFYDFKLERAFNLSAMLGKGEELNRKVVSHIEQLLQKQNDNEPLSLSLPLLDLLLEVKTEKEIHLAQFAENAANAFETQNNHNIAREYWNRASQWHARANDEKKLRESKLHLAECYEKDIQYSEQVGDKLFIIHHLIIKAIEAYRRIGNQKKKVEKLEAKLEIIQPNLLDSFSEIKIECDIPNLGLQARKAVEGKSFIESLFHLAFSCDPCKSKSIIEAAKKNIEKSPFLSLASKTTYDKNGMIIARRPSQDNKELFEEGILKEIMIFQMQINRNITVNAFINPARLQITADHNIRIRDFYQIVQNNPFIPSGREHIFALGLYYGLIGDFLLSSHILIPQAENSIRYMLQQKKIITSKLTNDLIQEKYTITSLFPRCEKELIIIIGEDMYFELRWLQIDKMDSNIRNLHCHGLVDNEEYFSDSYIYFWWLILRLCMRLN